MKTKCLITSLALIMPFYSANAEIDSKKIMECAAIENSADRLECYDKIPDSLESISEKSTAESKESKWDSYTKKDPLTDENIYHVFLEADSGTNKYGESPYLAIRCKNNKTVMFIGWDTYLGQHPLVAHRIGKNKSTTSYWSVSTNSEATLFPSSPIPTIKKMMESDPPSFVAQTTPHNSNPITAVFDLTGMEDALKDIRKGCNW